MSEMHFTGRERAWPQLSRTYSKAVKLISAFTLSYDDAERVMARFLIQYFTEREGLDDNVMIKYFSLNYKTVKLILEKAELMQKLEKGFSKFDFDSITYFITPDSFGEDIPLWFYYANKVRLFNFVPPNEPIY